MGNNRADSKMVASVKKAMLEIEQDKLHQKVHDRISYKLGKEAPAGKVGMAKCGMCEQVFQYRSYSPTEATQERKDSNEK